LVSFLLPVALFGQDRCGTVEHIERTHPLLKQDAFEQWLHQKIKSRRLNASTNRIKASRKIPVVVHIIHKGEAPGTGTNISDAQVISQISVLNKDYQRLNEDASKTPAIFQPVAASMDVEFVLARRTPEGLPTNGIVRVAGPADRDWTSADDAEFKALSYWDSNKYMNIWVIDIIDYLGYSQFPVSDLPGLEGSPDAPLTDGIVINPKVFGSIDDGSFDLDPDYNKGRTTTHEVGHFFGLRHTWGDDGGACVSNGGSGDYIDDTPDQGNNSVGCPNVGKSECGGIIMFQNYMDYTDDECMNLFTANQVERMNTVLENSPRRVSLLSSDGLNDPDPVTTENITIKSVSAPIVTCSETNDVIIRLKNNGVEVNSFKVKITVNGDESTLTSSGFVFPTGEEADYLINDVSFHSGINNIVVEFIEPNGNDDTFPADNIIAFKTEVNQNQDFIPLKQNFETPDDLWTKTNPLLGMEWEEIQTNFGTSIFFNGFGNQKNGDKAWYVSPMLDLSVVSEASLQFDISYAFRQGTADNLKVYASTDCNGFEYILFNETGQSIMNNASNSKWKPEDEGDWERKKVSLESLIGQPAVRIAFVFTNSNGNNLYLDNIEFFNATNPIETVGRQVLQVFPSGVAGPPPSLRLNLPERDHADIEVINSMGQRIKHFTLNDALNQTIDLGLQTDRPSDPPMYSALPGVYFVRVTTSKSSWVEKFVVVR
jgi:hypothetical protein